MVKKGLKIVVTGGGGFIGSWVVDHLLKKMGEQIDQIVVLDLFTRGTLANMESALKSNKIKVVKGDICDTKTVDKVIAGADYVIHEAAIRITQCAEDPRLCKDVLIDGTFNIMEACIKHKVKKLIFNSSASVYGQPVKLPMKETDNYNNDTMYGAAKIADEQMAKAFRKMSGLNYVCLRPFNAYGPRMDTQGVYTEVLIRWLGNIKNGEKPVIFGTGENTLDFVYVEDIAKMTLLALKSSVCEGFYNVGSGKQVSLNQLATMILKLTHSGLTINYLPQTGKTNYATRRQASTLKSRKDLGFKAQISLREGLTKLIEWYQDH